MKQKEEPLERGIRIPTIKDFGKAQRVIARLLNGETVSAREVSIEKTHRLQRYLQGVRSVALGPESDPRLSDHGYNFGRDAAVNVGRPKSTWFMFKEKRKWVVIPAWKLRVDETIRWLVALRQAAAQRQRELRISDHDLRCNVTILRAVFQRAEAEIVAANT